MSSEKCDIVIVGCGFAALSLLRQLSDLKIISFEEHKEVGYPAHCTGLISYEALEHLGSLGRESIINSFKSMTLYSPSWIPLTIDYKCNRVFIIDRVNLEQSLYDYVLSSHVNTRFYFKERVEKISLDKGVVVTNSNRLVKAGIVVDCEGARQVFLNIVHGRRRGVRIYGLQWDVKAKFNLSLDEFVVFFSNKLTPGYFSWLIPLDEKQVRMGIGGYDVNIDKLKLVQSLYIKHRILGQVYDQGKPFGGTIVLGPPLLRDYVGNLVFLGDAGFHTKPLTGGGIYTIGLFSRVLANSLNKYGATYDALKAYHKESIRIRQHLLLQYVISKVFHNLSDQEKDHLWKVFNQHGVGLVLSKGSFDFHEANVKLLMKRPLLLHDLIGKVSLHHRIKDLMESIKDLLS